MPKGVHWAAVKVGSPYRDGKWLRARYLDDLWSACQIARFCGANDKVIAYWLDKHGVPLRGRTGRTGPLAPNWQGGISEVTWKRVAYSAHGRQCQDCGRARGCLDVHHIDRNRHNNVPENLRVLCRSCHKLLHFREDPWVHVNFSRAKMGNQNARGRAWLDAHKGSQ